VPAIHALVARYAAQGLLLPRLEEEIRAHVDRFLVIVEGRKLMGCVALEPYGSELAEIRSVAVDDGARGRGLGARLIEYALAEARRRGYARVFATTHAPEIFTHHGFKAISRHVVPEKIERDCRTCPKSNHCEKLALVAVLAPERIALPILQPAIAL
jgi:N-acetylglutamate synthase-like GNAT family acetyltransferase